MVGDWSALLKPTARRVLDILLAGPASLTTLSEKTELSKPSLLRHLNEMESLGVLSRAYRSEGSVREAVYSLEGCSLHLELRPGQDGRAGVALGWATPGETAPAFPLLAQIRPQGARADVAEVLRALESGAPEAWPHLFVIVFGSIAKGEATRKSDIDLMVVLPDEDRHLQDRLADILARAQERTTLPIQPFFATRASMLTRAAKMEAIAAREGVVVHADHRRTELWTCMTRYRTISL